MAESVDQKAGRYLAEGRVAVLHVDPRGLGAFEVLGSDDDPYEVIYNGGWSCNCSARVLECSHIVACQKITNFKKSKPRLQTSDDDITAQIAALFRVDT